VLVAVVPLALAAALLYAVSDFLEQRAARQAATRIVRTAPRRGSVIGALRDVWATLPPLIRDRRWAVGWAVGTLAYFVQGAALKLGSVAVVQSLQVTTLLFAMPLSARGRPERLRPTDWLAGAGICAGLAAFLVGRGSPVTAPPDTRGRLVFVLAVVAAGVFALVVISPRLDSPARTTALGLAAGASFACSATLVKLTAEDLTTIGVSGTAADWPGYCLALATGTGLVLQQAAFGSGRLATATAAIVVTNPLVGTAVAVVGFEENLPGDVPHLTAVAFGLALLAAGVTLLSRSPLIGASRRGSQKQ
jgi:drug/metabolite transporter (DMT)-like permease